MPKSSGRDWKALFEIYEMKKRDMSLAEFCRAFDLRYDVTRISFSRLNKRKQIVNDNEQKKEQTEQYDHKNEQTGCSVCSDPETVTVKDTLAFYDAFHKKVYECLMMAMERIRRIQSSEEKADSDIGSVRDVKEAYQGVNELLKALQTMMPYVIEVREKAFIESVIGKIQTKEFDITHAALEFSRLGIALPRSVEILLSKTEPIVQNVTFDFPNDEELERRAKDALMAVESQKNIFLTQRLREVTELKADKDFEFSEHAASL